MDGGGFADTLLMIRLSKSVITVMTDEYRTTKACLVCKKYDLNMKYSKRNATSYNKHLNTRVKERYKWISVLRM